MLLQLFDPAAKGALADKYAQNIAAALSALAGDLDAVVPDSSSFEEKITILCQCAGTGSGEAPCAEVDV